MRDFAKVLKECFEKVIIPKTLINTQIDISICILENDGAYKAASFNAVTLALIVAGVPITDMVIGCTSGMIDDALTLDLTNDEEKGRHKSMLNISYSANHKTIISMDLQSKKLTPEQMEKLIELCSKGCEKIHEEMRGVLSNYIQNS